MAHFYELVDTMTMRKLNFVILTILFIFISFSSFYAHGQMMTGNRFDPALGQLVRVEHPGPDEMDWIILD